MGLLSKLFSSGEDPMRAFSDPVLGAMTWSADEEGWIGRFNGFNFCINHGGLKTPDESVLAYARETLSDAAWLNTSLAEAKAKYKSKLGTKMIPAFREEIDELGWEILHFGLRQHAQGEKRWIFAPLIPGREHRCWRLEYLYRDCHGLGFDT